MKKLPKKEDEIFTNQLTEKFISLRDFRIQRSISGYGYNMLDQFPVAQLIYKCKNTLLQFYSRNIISNSLDFHFIIKMLLAIHELKEQFKTCMQGYRKELIE